MIHHHSGGTERTMGGRLGEINDCLEKISGDDFVPRHRVTEFTQQLTRRWGREEHAVTVNLASSQHDWSSGANGSCSEQGDEGFVFHLLQRRDGQTRTRITEKE